MNAPITIRRGLSLVELLMSILILGIGIISIAALYPAGIAQQRQSVDDIMGPLIAKNAMAVIRMKVKPEDFGRFDFYRGSAPPAASLRNSWWIEREDLPLASPATNALQPADGDWPWMRPGFILEDDPSTVRHDGMEVMIDTGAIDIFSWYYKALSADTTGVAISNIRLATEFPDGLPSMVPARGPDDEIYGIPYNRTRYDFLPPNNPNDPDIKPQPRFIISARERSYPMFPQHGVLAQDEGIPDAQYHWECMFRRHVGQIQVAIFVYRVDDLPGDRQEYRVTQNVTDFGGAMYPAIGEAVPPLPIRLTLLNNGDYPAWSADMDPLVTQTLAGTDIENPDDDDYDILNHLHSWQAPRQWLLDQNGNRHRVLVGRTSKLDQGVQLQRPINELSRTYLPPGGNPAVLDDYTVSPFAYCDRTLPVNDQASDNIVTDIWYLPRVRFIDDDGDGAADRTIEITPVFMTVENL